MKGGIEREDSVGVSKVVEVAMAMIVPYQETRWWVQP